MLQDLYYNGSLPAEVLTVMSETYIKTTIETLFGSKVYKLSETKLVKQRLNQAIEMARAHLAKTKHI